MDGGRGRRGAVRGSGRGQAALWHGEAQCAGGGGARAERAGGSGSVREEYVMQVCRAKQQPVLRGDADDGSRMLGAELDPPSIGYFWLQTERDFDPALYDFFGKGHYVEVADQSYGRYG